MMEAVSQSMSFGESHHYEDLRVVLLGKTGAGKSSTGNTLLGREAFRVARGLRSGTEKCQWADADIEDLDVNIQVTDTPGVSDTHRPEDEVLKEVGKSIAVANPGPHVILMVIRCDTRFTPEEYMAYITLKQIFGEEVTQHMILVFVGTDSFGSTLAEQNMGLQSELNGASGNMKTVLDEAQWRFCGMNNKACESDRNKQARELIGMIKAMKRSHGGRFFQNSISAQVQEMVEPLVQNRRAQGHMSNSQAVRETNQAIVEEKESPGFFKKLYNFMSEKVLPKVKQGLEVARTVLGSVQTVRMVVKGVRMVRGCSVM